MSRRAASTGAGAALATAFLCLVCIALAGHVWPAIIYTTGGCIMTFMQPSYQPLPVINGRRQYTLERYVEGSIKRKLGEPPTSRVSWWCYIHTLALEPFHPRSRLPDAVADAPKDTSIPVLFLPGSSGSKAQARSIASEAYRQAEKQIPTWHNSSFTVYTVGTNEETSAMDARLVNSQARFVASCLQHLQTLHTAPAAIVVGHSMGVILALCDSFQCTYAQ